MSILLIIFLILEVISFFKKENALLYLIFSAVNAKFKENKLINQNQQNKEVQSLKRRKSATTKKKNISIDGLNKNYKSHDINNPPKNVKKFKRNSVRQLHDIKKGEISNDSISSLFNSKSLKKNKKRKK